MPKPAEATHGNCFLDVAGGPDDGHNSVDQPSSGPVQQDDPTGDIHSHTIGQSHSFTARLITPVRDPAGFFSTCVPTQNVNIDFENENGANDTDGISYNSPDKTCTVSAGSVTAQCQIAPGYTGLNSGTDIWRAWIDHDGSQSTTEADTAEGVNEVTASGNGGNNCQPIGTVEPEPDCTDVTQVNWGVPGGLSALDCDDSGPPDTEREFNPTGAGSSSSEVYLCRTTGPVGQLVAPSTTADQGFYVYGEVENGVNDPDPVDGQSYTEPDYTCIISEEGATRGTCSITVSQAENEAGTAEICFWVASNTDSGDNPAAPNGSGERGAQLCTGTSPPAPTSNQGAEPTGENQAADGSDLGNDAADQVELSWGARAADNIDAEPESQANVIGSSASIAAQIFDQFATAFESANTIIKFEFFAGGPSDRDGNTPATPDLTCNPGTASSCSVTFSNNPAVVGVDLVCVWIGPDPIFTGNNTGGNCDAEGLNDDDDDIGAFDAQGASNDNQDVVQVQWQDPNAANRVDCSPELGAGLPGTSYTVTCSATNGQGITVAQTPIDIELTGANDTDNANSPLSPDFSCITGGDGSCSFTHGPSGTSQGGLTTYRAWVDSDNNNATVEADMTEARDETVTPGSRPEADNTDVVEKNWGGSPTTLTISPTQDTAQIGSCNAFTVTVTDASGAGLAGIIIDAEQRHALADNTTANDEPTVGFCTPATADGPNPSSVDPARGDLRQPDENPDNLGTSGGETLTTTDSAGKVTFGINVTASNGSNGTGNVTVRVWTEGTDNDDPETGELQATATKTWSLTAPTSPGPTTTSPGGTTTPPTGPGTRTISLSASSNTVKVGQSVSLNGTVTAASGTSPTCVSNVSVTIQRDVLGGSTDYVDFASATTTSSGAFSTNVRADKGANYIAKVVDGSPPGCLAATSSPEVVKVRVRVTLKASRTRIRPGRAVTLTARLAPCEGHAGDQLTLLRKNAGQTGFRKAASVSTDGNCVAKFKGRLRKTATFRAKWARQDEDHLSGKSRAIKIRVRRG